MRHRWMAVSFLALGLMLVAGAPLMAMPQGQQGSAPPGEMSEQDARDWGLSDQQKEQIKAINQTRREQIQTIQQDDSLTREQKREKIRETNRKAHQQIDQLLTPEQREAYRRRIQERREEHRGRQRDGRRRDRPQPPNG